MEVVDPNVAGSTSAMALAWPGKAPMAATSI